MKTILPRPASQSECNETGQDYGTNQRNNNFINNIWNTPQNK